MVLNTKEFFALSKYFETFLPKIFPLRRYLIFLYKYNIEVEILLDLQFN